MTAVRTVPGVATLLLVLLGAASPARAQARQSDAPYMGAGNLGIGFQIGSPTGFTAKYYLGGSNAIDAAVGAWFDSLHLHADYLYEGGDLLGEPTLRLGWFIGAGGRIVFHDDDRRRNNNNDPDEDDDDVDLGARFPVGLELRFRELPRFELFVEVAPGMEIVDDPGLTVDGALGGRFYF